MRIVCCDPFTWNIVSYLTAWPSRDLIRAAHQQITRDWWAFKRSEFALHISQAVLDEAGAGDAKAAADRMNILKGIPILDLSPGVEQLTEKLKR